jgi:hypothetical protein
MSEQSSSEAASAIRFSKAPVSIIPPVHRDSVVPVIFGIRETHATAAQPPGPEEEAVVPLVPIAPVRKGRA